MDIVLYPEDFEFDEASDEAIRTNNQTKTMVNTLTNWLVRGAGRPRAGRRRLHLHFLHNPVEILGEDGKVAGIKFERTGTGRHRQRPRHRRVRRLPGPGRLPRHRLLRLRAARGWSSTQRRGVIPNDGGRVLDADGDPVPGIYATGWIKRGPGGPDRAHQGRRPGDHRLPARGPAGAACRRPPNGGRPSSNCSRSAASTYTTWEGWLKLDAHERALGAAAAPVPTANGPVERERIKVVDRERMVELSRPLEARA